MHGPEKKRAVDSRWSNDETLLYQKLAEGKRLQRKRSEVREGSADRAASTQYVCITGDVTMSVEIIPFKKPGTFPVCLASFFFSRTPLDEQ